MVSQWYNSVTEGLWCHVSKDSPLSWFQCGILQWLWVCGVMFHCGILQRLWVCGGMFHCGILQWLWICGGMFHSKDSPVSWFHLGYILVTGGLWWHGFTLVTHPCHVSLGYTSVTVGVVVCFTMVSHLCHGFMVVYFSDCGFVVVCFILVTHLCHGSPWFHGGIL